MLARQTVQRAKVQPQTVHPATRRLITVHFRIRWPVTLRPVFALQVSMIMERLKLAWPAIRHA